MAAGMFGADRNPATDIMTASPVDDLIRLSIESNKALMRGDIDTYADLLAFAPDFTLFSPFGGEPTRGVTEEILAAMGRFFRDGTLKVEVVQAYGTADMVVLALIERAHVAVGDVPMQDWALRVTLVYRRDGGTWALVHRHADPLVEDISRAESAALARRKAA